jgi:DNA polymerase III subunit delta
MSPDQFLGSLKRKSFPPAYLFLGSEAYNRARCRAALVDAFLGPDERENGLTRHDLSEVELRDAIDDARSLSLFATNRILWLSSAESVLPRGRAAESDDDDEGGGAGASALVDYLRDPAPEVVLVLEASRFDFEGDDKKKLERVAKFFSSVPVVVEFKRHSADEALREAVGLARQAGVVIDRVALDLLVESLGADVARIAVEIEKLSLYSSKAGVAMSTAIGVDEISALVPDARATTVFALVNAMGRRDRKRSMEILDTLVREGEYLPLALAFLSTQFRMALIAREAGLRSAGQIQGHFSKAGVAMWGSRAEQVLQTVTKFSREQLELGLKLIFQADRDLRSPRPDDRIVIENFILKLTA